MIRTIAMKRRMGDKSTKFGLPYRRLQDTREAETNWRDTDAASLRTANAKPSAPVAPAQPAPPAASHATAPSLTPAPVTPAPVSVAPVSVGPAEPPPVPDTVVSDKSHGKSRGNGKSPPDRTLN
jgi:hypothetical protein